MLMQVQTQIKDRLTQLLKLGKIRAIDLAFADFIYSEELALDSSASECLAMLAAYVSAQTGEQHSCVQLSDLGQPFAGVYTFPNLEELQTYLDQAHSIARLENQQPKHGLAITQPLVVQNARVYLQRYWTYEQQLAAIIQEKAAKKQELDMPVAQALLAELFTHNEGQGLDWQKVAVGLAASQSLSFITGGPGTGKTTTVTKLLALLQGLAAAKGKVLNIQLVAPTGKAAARLTESISQAKQKLPVTLQQNLPQQCQTIHRLLGAKPLSPYFKANAAHPLHLDVLVLDEASMVDLPLMAKLFAALPSHAQVVVLGDQDQLASVETGCVLSDICLASNSHLGEVQGLAIYSQAKQTTLCQLLNIDPVADSPQQYHSIIQDNVVRLAKSHRFSQNSGIGQLAKAIKQGQNQEVKTSLSDTGFSDIQWYQPKETRALANAQKVQSEIMQNLIVKLLPKYHAYLDAVKQGEMQLAFDLLSQQQVLCAQKTGAWGVKQITQLIEAELAKQGLIDPSKDFYLGRPIMLAKNDHQLKLFNGDIGIVMPDPHSPNLNKVWFVAEDGHFRGLLPSRLPSLDTVYAMTIHKSQGSEFDSVYLCLPTLSSTQGGRGLNRELIYTGLTRAKQFFMLFASEEALNLSLSQQCLRGSGLAQRLTAEG
ncbi:exodeoxyribonuclease V subunit alpha [Paraglaciecola aestuariivivens]